MREKIEYEEDTKIMLLSCLCLIAADDVLLYQDDEK